MARGTTLVRLLDLYRAECRLSLNPAHNAQARDAQVSHLQRVQEWLWADHDWPLLRVERFIDVQQGQRYYAPPEDIPIDRIQKLEIRHDSDYVDMAPGIDQVHFRAYDSDQNEQEWPPRRWRVSEDEQIELWPIPSANFEEGSLNGRIRVTGIRKLSRLVDDGDRADLDDRMLALYCAAEYLAGTGAKDAGFKLEQANKRFATLRGQQAPRRKFSLFVDAPSDRVQRVPLAVYNKPGT
jgi:hypothetical protein